MKRRSMCDRPSRDLPPASCAPDDGKSSHGRNGSKERVWRRAVASRIKPSVGYLTAKERCRNRAESSCIGQSLYRLRTFPDLMEKWLACATATSKRSVYLRPF